MITLAQFYKGRDKEYARDLTPEIQKNALETLLRANLLLDKFCAANPRASSSRGCNSGWRPPTVNADTHGAAKKSNHMIGKAIDIDDDDGSLDKWLITPVGLQALVDIGLWLENPVSTPRWSHIQTVPPKSGRRVFSI